MTKQELASIVNQLVALGEDKEELEYWIDIYDDLDEENKKRIVQICTDELAALRPVKSL